MQLRYMYFQNISERIWIKRVLSWQSFIKSHSKLLYSCVFIFFLDLKNSITGKLFFWGNLVMFLGQKIKYLKLINNKTITIFYNKKINNLSNQSLQDLLQKCSNKYSKKQFQKMIKVPQQIMMLYDRIANERPVYTVIDKS